MIRVTLHDNSTNAYTDYRQNYFIQTLWRAPTSTLFPYTRSSDLSPPLPYWMKIVRSGSTFSSYGSPDGMAWTTIGSNHTITMAQSVYIGLAVSSTANTTLETATFDNVSISSTAAPAPVITSFSPP